MTGVTDENSSQVVGYSYDMDGNLSGRTVPGNNMTATYAYDYQNRLTSLANQTGAGVISQYTSEYLANGQKSEETSEAVDEEGKKSKKTTFVWDGDQMVMELDASGKVQRRYIRGNDRGYGSNLVYADKGNGTEKQYYVTDPHGNVVQLTDEKGKVIKIYEYDSFGNEVNPDSKDENPFRCCGEYYDKEMEEIYLRARYYEPNVGRFLTRDSYTGEDDEPLSLHLYTYCENDGVNSVDPSGHWRKETHEKITKVAIKKVKKLKKSNRYIYKKIIHGCTYPDRVRKTNKKVLNMLLNDKKTHGDWHGKKKLKQVRVFSKKVMKKINKSKNKKGRSILLGCILHSLEDWYAHSYGGSINEYRKNPNKYSDQSTMALFHIDKKRVKNSQGKVVKLENLKTKHRDNNDNEEKDFNKKTKEWKDSDFNINKRIKGAIKETVNLLKKIRK